MDFVHNSVSAADCSICIISSEDANSDQDADKVNKNYKFQKFKMVETFTDADF